METGLAPALLSSHELNQLIHACYQGPMEKSLWASFLQELKKTFDARYVTLLLRPPKAGDKGVVLNAFVSSDEAYHTYKEHYFSQDPFVNLPLGKAVIADEILDMAVFKQSEYYLNYLKPVDVEYMLGADLADENGYSARLRISRGAAAKNFGAAEKALLEVIMPHLTQSIVLYSRIIRAETKAQAYQDAFNQMEMGCVILDNQLRILSKNRAANDLLNSKLGLVIKDNELIIGNREEHRQFRVLAENMLAIQRKGGLADVSAFRVEVPNSVTGLGMLCRALSPTATPDGGAAIALFISNPEKPKLSKVTILEQLFGLTLSEAKLALLLANGLSLDEASAELGITRNTAKSHLSATFSKTGVTRQPSLVQLILRSVASIG